MRIKICKYPLKSSHSVWDWIEQKEIMVSECVYIPVIEKGKLLLVAAYEIERGNLIILEDNEAYGCDMYVTPTSIIEEDDVISIPTLIKDLDYVYRVLEVIK